MSAPSRRGLKIYLAAPKERRMHSENIERFVQRRLREGYSLETVWKEAQAAFPHKIVAWSHVKRIEREMLERDA